MFSVSLIFLFASFIRSFNFAFFSINSIFPFHFVAYFPLMLLGVDFDIIYSFHIKEITLDSVYLPALNFKPNDSER